MSKKLFLPKQYVFLRSTRQHQEGNQSQRILSLTQFLAVYCVLSYKQTTSGIIDHPEASSKYLNKTDEN